MAGPRSLCHRTMGASDAPTFLLIGATLSQRRGPLRQLVPTGPASSGSWHDEIILHQSQCGAAFRKLDLVLFHIAETLNESIMKEGACGVLRRTVYN